MSLKPPIKWAGGKTQLLDSLLTKIPSQFTGRYFEPFIGGGALWLNLQPQNWVINDINNKLTRLWMEIRDNSDDLTIKISNLQELYLLSGDKKTFYYDIRKQFNQDLNIPVNFLFLNKYCFNGLYRENKKGEFNVPWNQKTDKAHWGDLEDIANYMNRTTVEVRNLHWKDAISDASEGDFIYFDPPYAKEKATSFVSYTNNQFEMDDQKELALEFKKCAERGVYCMLSNSNTAEVHKLYEEFNITEVNATRAISRNKTGRKSSKCEVIITSFEIL